jgi:hypothetical protein
LYRKTTGRGKQKAVQKGAVARLMNEKKNSG